jgi:hypothetical protein
MRQNYNWGDRTPIELFFVFCLEMTLLSDLLNCAL